jgi:sigma-B regulation protein RsbQ
LSQAPLTHARDAVLRRNNVQVRGHDLGQPALVFVNGFGGEQGMWRSVAPFFAAGRRVVLFDHVGTGGSQGCALAGPRYASLQGYADDLLEVCDAVGESDAVAVAHSCGATMAMLAAIRSPASFRHLVLVAPSPCFRNDGSYLGGFERQDLDTLLQAMELDYRHWARQLAPMIMGHPERPELARELESALNRIDPAIARQFARLCFGGDDRQLLARLTTPTTILQAAEDNIVPEVVGEFMQESIPRCELVRLRATGHFPHLSAPQQVVQALRELLDESWAETQPAALGH